MMNQTGLIEGESKCPVWAVPVLALVMVLATAGLVVTMLTGGGHSIHLGRGSGGRSTPTPSSSMEAVSDSDQGDAGAVPPKAVTGLTATPSDSEVRWGQEVPERGQYQPGALGFEYTLTQPGEAMVAETMRRSSLTIATASGRNCLTMGLAVTPTGRGSAPIIQCVTVSWGSGRTTDESSDTMSGTTWCRPRSRLRAR